MDNAKQNTTSIDPMRWLNASPWQRFAMLRWLRNKFANVGFGYVSITNDPEQLWYAAMRHAPVRFRWFGYTLTIDEVDSELNGYDQWISAKQHYKAGDRIWPFIINPDTLAMRLGYVIVRNGQPITGVVTIVS